MCIDTDPYNHIGLVKFHTCLFNPSKLFEYLFQKNIDFYEEQIKYI